MRRYVQYSNSARFQIFTELLYLKLSVLMRSQCVHVCACMCECSMCHDVWVNAQVYRFNMGAHE